MIIEVDVGGCGLAGSLIHVAPGFVVGVVLLLSFFGLESRLVKIDDDGGAESILAGRGLPV